LKKISNQSGIITKTLKIIPNVFFENGILIVLSALILLLPIKMIYIFITNNWNNEYIYCGIQAGSIYLGFVIGVIFLAKTIIEYGFSYITNLFKTHKWLICFTGFLIWSLISSVFSDDPNIAFYSNLNRNEGYIVFVYYIIVFLIAGILKSSKKKRLLLNVFAVSATLLCAVTVLQRFNAVAIFFNMQDCVLFTSTGKYESVFCYFNHYGYYLCMAILCCTGLILTDRKKKSLLLHVLLMIANVWSLVLNDTFGSYLAAAITVCIIPALFIMKAKMNHESMNKWTIFRMVLPWLIFVVISFSSSLSQNSILSQFGELTTDMGNVITDNPAANAAGTGRWYLWKTTSAFIADRPLFGYGAEGLIDKYADLGFINDRPANEYLQYAAFFGIPGMILYLLALLSILIACMKKLKTLNPITLAIGGCVIAYAISACFGNTMYYTTVYFYMFLGLVSRDEECG